MLGLPPETVLDNMSEDEITAIMKARADKNKEEWERVRVTSYWSVVANQGSKSIKKPSDLFKFAWEVDDHKPDRVLTREEMRERFNKVHRS